MNRLTAFCVYPFLGMLFGLTAAEALAIESDSRHAAVMSITGDEVKAYVAALADDTFEGRESGSRGNRAAGIYITERLKKFGLQPEGAKGSFYQPFGSYHNILGRVEGRDPALRDEVVVISAHYDHVGYGSSRNSFGPVGLIHNGADDNASGVAALLEVAEAVSQLAEKPRRSILFAFWDGEEKGLLGSKHWVEHPTVPLDHVPVMINADMVGRLRDSGLIIYGARTSRGLRQLISRQNDLSRLPIDFSWEMKADSDHHTFYSRNIPVLMMFTGLHGDYHRPSDDAEKINVDGLQRIAQLMFNVVVELADTATPLAFRREVREESRAAQQASERPLPPVPGRLGIRWDEKAAETGTIVVASVAAGSAADKAGLRAGDKLLKFGDHEIASAEGLRRSVLAAKSPVPVEIERPGEATRRTATLELPGNPQRVGISWRVDDAEPDCVIINRVTPGSPADLAALHVNDRIYRIDGKQFTSGGAFRQLIADATGPIRLEIERSGRLSTAEITPTEGEPESVPATTPDPAAPAP